MKPLERVLSSAATRLELRLVRVGLGPDDRDTSRGSVPPSRPTDGGSETRGSLNEKLTWTGPWGMDAAACEARAPTRRE